MIDKVNIDEIVLVLKGNPCAGVHVQTWIGFTEVPKDGTKHA